MKATGTAAMLAALALSAWVGRAGAAELRGERLAQAGSGSATGSGSAMGSGSEPEMGSHSGTSSDPRIDPNTGMRSGAEGSAAANEDPRSAARRQGADTGTGAAAQRSMGSGTGSPNTDTPSSGSNAPYNAR